MIMMLSGRPTIDTYSASAVTKLQSQDSISRTINYLRYKETSDQKTNFLTEKVIEPRSLHLYQRYLSFDILNHSLGTTFDRILFIRELIPIILLPTIYLIDTLFHL